MKITAGKFSAALTLSVFFCLSAVADALPDQVDLKAAYCLPIVRWRSETFVDENLPDVFKRSMAEIRAKGIDDLHRLKLYLVPRISQLEINGIEAASKRGREDLERFFAEINACTPEDVGEKRNRCLSMETEATKRVRSCTGLSFLPF